MARPARVIFLRLPYHVTHRGNRRSRIFFEEEDREAYLAHLERYSRQHGLAVWSWCLMSNHLHLLVVPVRAAMVPRAEDYCWSSAAVHCGRTEERNSGNGGLLAGDRPFPGEIGEDGWSEWLAHGVDEATLERLRRNRATGRPCGGEDFVTWLEREFVRILKPQKAGRKPKAAMEVDPTADLFEDL